MDFRSLPKHRFKTLLVDPPWQYQTRSPKGEGRSASQHYSIMTLADLAALPVRDVCDVDCWLFMWAISSKLDSAIWLMREWGFKYSGVAFTWIKMQRNGQFPIKSERDFFFGMGHTTRKNSEICLLGRRGAPPILKHDVRELIISPVRAHSQKPDEQYPRIERFCGGPRLELFARNLRPGWTSWGLETDKFSQAAE